MSLFSLNRIYKPNRHTPTPLAHRHTETHYLFSSACRETSAPLQHTRTLTHTRSLSAPPTQLRLQGFRQRQGGNKKGRKKKGGRGGIKSEANWSRWREVLSAGRSDGGGGGG